MNQYVVKPGDTLSAIAKHYYGDTSRAKDIAKVNGIEHPDLIQAGRTLVLPDVSDSSSNSKTRSQQGEGFRVTELQLAAIVKTTAEVAYYCGAVNACLQRYEMNTPLRAAHFLAQVAHESGGLRYVEENLNYSAQALRSVFSKYFQDDAIASDYARQPQKIANRVYANRMGNGSELSGDGWRYRGRGLIQLTGKSNYTQYADARQVDVVQTPDLVATDPILATDVAGWYWKSCDLNRYADNDDIRAITKRINGGYNGLEDRQGYLQRAKGAFGA